jgi:S-adenosylmethionine-diacylglycerol 3-amino-3-carboxypropyl transferase
MISNYVNNIARCRDEVLELLDAPNLAQQQAIYPKIKEKIWSRAVRFAMNRDSTLSMLGVPRAPKDDKSMNNTLAASSNSSRIPWIRCCRIFPIQDNYFWRVYITGSYTPTCCPSIEAPQPRKIAQWGSRSIDDTNRFRRRISPDAHNGQISRFVLLDHMDWLSDHYFPTAGIRMASNPESGGTQDQNPMAIPEDFEPISSTT